MSRLEIILVAVMVCILAGAGTIYLQRNKPQAVSKVATPPTTAPVVNQPNDNQNQTDEGRHKKIVNKCMSILEKGKSITLECGRIIKSHPQRMIAEADALMDRAKKRQPAGPGDKERAELLNIESGKVDKCLEYLGKELDPSPVVELIKAKRFEELNSFCDDLQASFPPGF